MTETPNPHIVDADTLTGEMHPIRRCVIAIGSNLGERKNNLQGAVSSLVDTPEVWVTAVSPVYETEPVGGPGGQGAYLNMVVELDTEASPRELLGLCRRLEAAAERVREVRWGPRTLDVDIVWVDGATVAEPDGAPAAGATSRRNARSRRESIGMRRCRFRTEIPARSAPSGRSGGSEVIGYPARPGAPPASRSRSRGSSPAGGEFP